jgi:hypothetical protein
MTIKPVFRAICCLALAATASALVQTSVPAGGQPPPVLPQDANQYVRQVIQHELEADGRDQSLWRYRFHRESERIIYDRDVIETRDGQIARTLLISGQPLTPKQRADDDARLQSLMRDADDRARHNKRIKDDRDRARRMLKALPDALDFKYDGMEDGLVRLQFSPKPHYDAPTRELQAYRSMTGTLWIDHAGVHLARIDGKLFEDVNFGWGLLGKLKKGGTFHVVQKEVVPGHWEIVALDVDMTGYAVIFKSINVKQHQRQSDFHRMPDDMTLSRAYELLQKDPLPVTTAENAR